MSKIEVSLLKQQGQKVEVREMDEESTIYVYKDGTSVLTKVGNLKKGDRTAYDNDVIIDIRRKPWYARLKERFFG